MRDRHIPPFSMPFSEKVVWVTGASSGIGKALALELAGQGARMVLSARNEQRLEETRTQCVHSDRHMLLPLDVTDEKAVVSAPEQILQKMGRLDIVVLNAGIGQRGSVMETSTEIHRHLMEVNFFGQTIPARAVLPHFIKENQGQFVVITSIMGKVATPRRATYAASKHALHGWFDALRAELHTTNINITVLCTGYIRTEISFHSVKGDGTPHGAMDDSHRNAMLPDVYARKAAKAIAQRRPIAFIGGPERFAPLLQRISPAFVRFLLPRLLKRD